MKKNEWNVCMLLGRVEVDKMKEEKYTNCLVDVPKLSIHSCPCKDAIATTPSF